MQQGQSTIRPALLTVDDDPQVLRAIERDLRRHFGRDYRVVGADSGDAALDALERRVGPLIFLRCPRESRVVGERSVRHGQKSLLHGLNSWEMGKLLKGPDSMTR